MSKQVTIAQPVGVTVSKVCVFSVTEAVGSLYSALLEAARDDSSQQGLLWNRSTGAVAVLSTPPMLLQLQDLVLCGTAAMRDSCEGYCTLRAKLPRGSVYSVSRNPPDTQSSVHEEASSQVDVAVVLFVLACVDELGVVAGGDSDRLLEVRQVFALRVESRKHHPASESVPAHHDELS